MVENGLGKLETVESQVLRTWRVRGVRGGGIMERNWSKGRERDGEIGSGGESGSKGRACKRRKGEAYIGSITGVKGVQEGGNGASAPPYFAEWQCVRQCSLEDKQFTEREECCP